MKYFITILTLTIFIACSSRQDLVKQDNVVEQPVVVEQPLELAESYLPLARNAEQMGDSLGAEYYYSRAMEMVTQFRDENSAEIDSVFQVQIENISLEYAKYLNRLNGIEKDSLSAAQVLEALSEIDGDSAALSDSALASMPDAIEDDGELSLPLVLNQKVENAIKYFTKKRGRRVYTRWLQRSGKYQPMITRILKEEGVPQELFYLAMIESGFNPSARSWAKAVGMWQFIYATGKAYGLKRSWWYDDRMDPEKATRAAAQHLRDLYKRFDNWYIAIAGYNFSPGKIERRIRKYQVDEFWELPRLPRETRNYIPTFIAAALIAKEPAKYGFYVEKQAPIVFDTVTVKETVDLSIVAKCVGSDFKTIKKLNPAILRFCTPPDVKKWVLNIPQGSRDQFIAEYAKIPNNKKMTWYRHRIRSGETLSTIARRYGVSMYEIKRFNKLRGNLIRAGHSLIIPVPQNKKYARTIKRQSTKTRSSRKRKIVQNVPGRTKTVHTIQQGESLWEIATKYGVTLSQIRKWNGLSNYSRLIKPGHSLNVWLPDGSSVSRATLAVAEKKEAKPQTAAVSQDKSTITYTVRSGDNLWDIAAKHGVSIREIKRWNNRRSNTIRPGDQLIIKKQ